MTKIKVKPNDSYGIRKIHPNELGWLVITGTQPPIQVYTKFQLDQLVGKFN